MNIPEFRLRIHESLVRLDRSEAWLARQLDYTPGQFGKWLSGANRIPYEAVVAICDRLDLPPLQQVQMMDLAGYPLPRWARVRPLLAAMNPAAAVEIAHASDQVREFATAAEYLEQVTYAIDAAKHAVVDLSWGINVPSVNQHEDDCYYEYLNSIGDSCRRGVTYREVMTFRDAQHFVERAESMLQQKLFAYSLRYYDIQLMRHPPLMSVMVVDGAEAFVAWYRWPHLPPHAEKRIATRQPAVVALLADYFETAWFGAKPIKDGDVVDWEELEKQKALWT